MGCRCLGDVAFKVGDADFSANRGWVRVLDFALVLEHLTDDLGKGKEDLELFYGV